MNKEPPVFKIRNDLIEAYKGHYSNAHVYNEAEHIMENVGPDHQGEEAWLTWIRSKILLDTPKERLERYLEWNGIIGFTSTIFTIATGKLS